MKGLVTSNEVLSEQILSLEAKLKDSESTKLKNEELLLQNEELNKKISEITLEWEGSKILSPTATNKKLNENALKIATLTEEIGTLRAELVSKENAENSLQQEVTSKLTVNLLTLFRFKIFPNPSTKRKLKMNHLVKRSESWNQT